MRSCLMRWLQAASAVCLRPDPRPWLFQGVPVHACVCVCARACTHEAIVCFLHACICVRMHDAGVRVCMLLTACVCVCVCQSSSSC